MERHKQATGKCGLQGQLGPGITRQFHGHAGDFGPADNGGLAAIAPLLS